MFTDLSKKLQDSNQDGIGDLNGILEKLDYIKSLGVSIIWLSIYKSPNKDNSYDISDYRAIMSEFGSMDDDNCRRNSYERNENNYGSCCQAYLRPASMVLESKAVNNPKRDYYIWKDPHNGSVPNNWKAFSADQLELDAQTGQYYLHSFVKERQILIGKIPK